MPHEVLEHAIEDSVNILPFLFLTYLVMEYIQHKIGNQSKRYLQKLNKYGPAVGSILGIFPQCGFSSVASNFYTGRIITLGTLIAVYLATSDEMLPVMLSSGAAPELIAKVLILKLLVGFAGGMAVDLLIGRRELNQRKGESDRQSSKLKYESDQTDLYSEQIEYSTDFEFNIHKKEEEVTCYCCKKGGILWAAIRHTLSTFVFLFLITAVLTFAIHELGEDRLAGFILNRPLIGEALAGLIGLIPNCAASVVLTDLYLGGGMSFSAMMSGLFAGSGVGILVLFHENGRNLKENMKILGILYGISVAAGWCVLVIGYLVIR